MAENTKIEWADHTFNPWTGCQKVSAGCDHCYAETWSRRSSIVKWGPGQKRRRTTAANWKMPLYWNAVAEIQERRARVFCASLADVFDNAADPSWRADLWNLIVDTPGLDWLILTKRPQNIRAMLPKDWEWNGPGYPNVWLGVSAEDQENLDLRLPILMEVPGFNIKFLSYEPALGPIELCDDIPYIPDWVIAGGESGGGARPCDPQWFRDLRNQCKDLRVAFFFKQWGQYSNKPLAYNGGDSDNRRYLAHAKAFDPPKNGKGGALLDGRLHREFPKEMSE